jgi:hypothetical protein
MPYLTCPHCKLSIRIQHANLWMAHCPRCIARAQRLSPLQLVDRDVSRGALNHAEQRPARGSSGSLRAKADLASRTGPEVCGGESSQALAVAPAWATS